MRHIIGVIFLLAAAPGLLVAQAASERRGQGYVFVAPGAVADDGAVGTLHVGVGGEGLVYKGLGVGAEIGYLGLTRGLGNGIGVFSANGSYHFRNVTSSGKLVPFVTGGYSLLFRGEAINAANFGGGINYWFHDRVGLRLEFRDHLPAHADLSHYVGFRFGLAFR